MCPPPVPASKAPFVQTPIRRHYLPCGTCGQTEFACPRRIGGERCVWKPQEEDMYMHLGAEADRPVDQQDRVEEIRRRIGLAEAGRQLSLPLVLPPEPGENPKARHGAAKSPLGLLPPPAEVAVAEVFGLGAAKYGAYNWRETRIEAMTYVHAMKRHLASYLDGENADPESGQSHLAHVAACAMILLDAYAIGKIDDNRPPAGIAADLIRSLVKPT